VKEMSFKCPLMTSCAGYAQLALNLIVFVIRDNCSYNDCNSADDRHHVLHWNAIQCHTTQTSYSIDVFYYYSFQYTNSPKTHVYVLQKQNCI